MTSLSQAGEKDDIDVRPGLTYATHDGVALLGDLYVPKGAGPFPVLVALHGGGWVQGVRAAFQHWGPYLAARGYAVFAISYRLAKTGQKTFPHAVQDALAAVQFCRGSAREYKLDPERDRPPGGVGRRQPGRPRGARCRGRGFPQRLSAG